VKPPDRASRAGRSKKVYEKEKIAIGTMAERIRHVVQACFNGRRIVVFSAAPRRI
jgi:class I fructose-bisphosphate aldolase